jgi:hypothetical protein
MIDAHRLCVTFTFGCAAAEEFVTMRTPTRELRKEAAKVAA